MMYSKYIFLFFALCFTGFLFGQGRYVAVNDTAKLGNIMVQFSPEIRWTDLDSAKQPLDTLDNLQAYIWEIKSFDFNEPVIAIFAPKMLLFSEGKSKPKNMLDTPAVYGRKKALFFFFKDGTRLKKGEISLLRKEKDIPGL